MALDIYFRDDVANRLLSLAQANERALKLAERYGMAAEVADLCWQIYSGALSDVAVAFGLMLPIPNREEISNDRKEIDSGTGHY